jgi:diguanylate cyclase (GGDEF)-like protein
VNDFAISAFMTAFTVTIGGIAGWFLALRTKIKYTVDQPDEVRRAREALLSLQRLSSMVACELGEHQGRVEEISGELTAKDGQTPDKILTAVNRLVEVNQKMQGKLDQAEDRLREQARLVESHTAAARTDALTLLGNRRAFDAEIGELFADYRRSGKRFALAMLDLDKFKRLNDTYGHQAGDEVLRTTARVVRRSIGDKDRALRYGGEEFAVLFPLSNVAEVQQALRRIRQCVEKTSFLFQDQKMPVTVSVGAAEAGDDTTVAELIQRADAALYQSKEAGRNCVHWHNGKQIIKLEDPVAVVEAAAPTPVETPVACPAPQPQVPHASEPDTTSDEALGLTNRTAFCQFVRGRLAEWKRGGTTVSLILMQIDEAEAFQRKHGVAGRDAAIAVMAKAVLSGVREMDLAARYTPYSIAFVLPQARLADAAVVAERIRKSVCGQGRSDLTVSMGVVEVSNADDIVTLFRRAELALEAAQTGGGNCLYRHDGKNCLPAEGNLGNCKVASV